MIIKQTYKSQRCINYIHHMRQLLNKTIGLVSEANANWRTFGFSCRLKVLEYREEKLNHTYYIKEKTYVRAQIKKKSKNNNLQLQSIKISQKIKWIDCIICLTVNFSLRFIFFLLRYFYPVTAMLFIGLLANIHLFFFLEIIL